MQALSTQRFAGSAAFVQRSAPRAVARRVVSVRAEGLADKAKDAVDSAAKNVKGAAGDVKDAAKNALNKADGKADELGDRAKSAGKDIESQADKAKADVKKAL